ncbi:hypothetical protein RFI_12741, partial [Reticulomyxa filosa]
EEEEEEEDDDDKASEESISATTKIGNDEQEQEQKKNNVNENPSHTLSHIPETNLNNKTMPRNKRVQVMISKIKVNGKHSRRSKKEHSKKTHTHTHTHTHSNSQRSTSVPSDFPVILPPSTKSSAGLFLQYPNE